MTHVLTLQTHPVPTCLFIGSVYDLLLDTTLLDIDAYSNSLINSISQQVAHKFDYNISCARQTELIDLLTWPDIYEVQQLAHSIIPQIEELLYSSWVRVETATIYRSIPFNQIPGHSSWRWHYDSCPDEYTKLIIYLSDVSLDDAPIEFLSGPNGLVPKYFSSRVSPEYHDSWQEMFNHDDRDRIPTDVIDNCISAGCTLFSLTGPRGTYALFSPNQPHRATIPVSASWRDVLVFQLRPALSNESWYNSEIGLRPLGDPKCYSLD